MVFITLVFDMTSHFLKLYSRANLYDLNGSEGRADNRKCRVIRKTNQEDGKKYDMTSNKDIS